MARKRVLFLCTGNSCRSQMAEAVVNARMGDKWHAFSAGVAPAGEIKPNTLKVLSELGIDHTGTSKHVNQFINDKFDLVVTVCDDAAENCPVWLGKGHMEHLSFRDPAKAEGTEEEKLETYRDVLLEISMKIPVLLETYEKQAA